MLIASDPSSSSRQDTRRAARVCWSSAAETCRCARANRSSCPAVIGPAISARSASVAGVAIRVSARTFAYDSCPAANPAQITGSARSARATRTCSRAVPGAIWHFHASHAAHEGKSHDAHPPRASKSPTSSKNRQVAAVRCPASSQICASSRSSGTPAGPAAAGPAGPGLPVALSDSLFNAYVSLMCLILARGTDNSPVPGTRWPTREPCPETCLAAIVQVNSLLDATCTVLSPTVM